MKLLLWMSAMMGEMWFLAFLQLFSLILSVLICRFLFNYHNKGTGLWKGTRWAIGLWGVGFLFTISLMFTPLGEVMSIFNGLITAPSMEEWMLFLVLRFFVIVVVSGIIVSAIFKQSLALGLLSSLVTTIFVWGGVIGALVISEECGPRLAIYHEFNAHLKDVCFRENKSECPRSEEQLVTYNPQKYSHLLECNRTTYWFDEVTGKYAWSVRELGSSLVLVSHPDFNEGFAGVYVDDWPPKVSAPWDKLIPKKW